jgi:hypothetical protein
MGRLKIIRSARNLFNYINRGSKKIVKVKPKKNGKGIRAKSKDEKLDFKKDDSTEITQSKSSSIPPATGSSGNNIVSNLIRKNNLMEESNALLRIKARNQEVANELTSARMSMDYDLSTARTLVLDRLSKQIQAIREMGDVVSLLSIDKHNFEQFGLKKDGSNIKNTSNEDIIPMHEKARYHSEKRIDEEKANKVDYTKLIFDDDDDDNDDNDSLFDNIFNKVFTFDKSKIPSHLLEDDDTIGVTNES